MSGRKKKAAYKPDLTTPFPALLTVDQIRKRLEAIFPKEFPDRGILVGVMAARVIFVALYGGFVEGAGRFLRPSFIYHFTEEQSAKVSDAERLSWATTAHVGGNRPTGKAWYADTSREPIRDDLIRSRLLIIGAMEKNVPDTHSTTASTPIYFLRGEFAKLFNPGLTDDALAEMIPCWQKQFLNPGTLQRMALRAQGIHRKDGDVLVDLPNGERVKLSSGTSNLIVKALIEKFATIHLNTPMVLWISASDKKSFPQFQALSASVGLYFDLSAELPDLILGDMSDPVTFYFCEVVTTDGPVTDARKRALLGLIRESAIQEGGVRFVTAFDDRESSPFRKVFSQLATDSLVWFRTEPKTIMIISTETRWIAG